LYNSNECKHSFFFSFFLADDNVISSNPFSRSKVILRIKRLNEAGEEREIKIKEKTLCKKGFHHLFGYPL
jgi:hypothetical protein